MLVCPVNGCAVSTITWIEKLREIACPATLRWRNGVARSCIRVCTARWISLQAARWKRTRFFRIYSMTKPVVSAAIMMLHDEGRMQLHDPVSRYIPSIGKMKVFSHVSDRVAKYAEQDPPMTVFFANAHVGTHVWK